MPIYYQSTVDAILGLIGNKYRRSSDQSGIEKLTGDQWNLCDFHQEMIQFLDDYYEPLSNDEVNATIVALESRF